MIITVAVILILTTFLLGLGIVVTKKLHRTNAFQTNYYQGVLILFISGLIAPYGFKDENYHKPSMI